MKSGNGIGVGIASVLVIVVVLALTTFGILSLAMARADQQMSQKSAEFTKDYYAAEGRLQLKIAVAADKLADGKNVFTNGELKLTEPVGTDRELRATLTQTAGGYEITEYRLVNTAEWVPENALNVWGG